MAERNIIANRRDPRDERDILEAELNARIPGFSEAGAVRKTKSPAETPAQRPVTLPSELGFRGEGKPEATFQDTVLDLADIGDAPNEVSIEEIRKAGGISELLARERFQTPVIRPTNEVLSALLGETTGTQRSAPDVEKLSPWQKGLLFVADINAAFDGRVLPSIQLRDQLKRSITLQDQQNQKNFLEGMKATNDFNEMIDGLPLEARIRAATQQSAQMRKIFGPGFGANLIALASEPTKQEALTAFLENRDTFEGGSASVITEYAAYLTGAGDTEGADRIIRENLIGSGKTKGALEMDALYFAPSLLEAKLDGFTNELRKLGGDNAALAEAIATGEKVSPSEIINANEKLPENSPFKLDKAVLRTLRVEPQRFTAVLPGMVGADAAAAEQVAMNDGERSTPMAFIGGPRSDEPGREETAPALGRRAQELMAAGYMPLKSQMDKLAGLGGGLSDSNMIRLGADFIKESGSFDKINMAFKTVLAASREPNAPGNVSMIFAFMKSLDPGSVVREGEQETAAKARARIDAIKTWMSRQITGERLTETQVNQFVRIAEGIWAESANEQARREQRWVQRLDGLNVPRDRHSAVIVDLIGSDRSRLGVENELQPVLDRFQ